MRPFGPAIIDGCTRGLAGLAVASALLAAPAAAGACPSFAKSGAFRGTASASFDQTASFDGTTVTLDRVAGGLQFPELAPASLGHGIVEFTGAPEGGSVTVNDVGYTNYGVSGGQTASGPTLGYPDAGKAAIALAPAPLGCRYAVRFSFAINTTTVGDFGLSVGDLG